jgi:hypothetical protein
LSCKIGIFYSCNLFNGVLQRETWHTRHENDKDQFFRALETVVYNPQFNADRLGEYIDQRREAGENAQAGILQLEYDEARNYYVDAAWAVSDFLRFRSTLRYLALTVPA